MYYAECLDANGCPSATRVPASLTINPLPAAPIVSDETRRLQGKGGGVKMEANRAELEALRAYARHHKLRLMIDRNERLVRELQDSRNEAGLGDGGERDPAAEVADIVHIYDALLQSVRDMITNLGGGEDARGKRPEATPNTTSVHVGMGLLLCFLASRTGRVGMVTQRRRRNHRLVALCRSRFYHAPFSPSNGVLVPALFHFASVIVDFLALFCVV